MKRSKLTLNAQQVCFIFLTWQTERVVETHNPLEISAINLRSDFSLIVGHLVSVSYINLSRWSEHTESLKTARWATHTHLSSKSNTLLIGYTVILWMFQRRFNEIAFLPQDVSRPKRHPPPLILFSCSRCSKLLSSSMWANQRDRLCGERGLSEVPGVSDQHLQRTLPN